MKVYLCISSTNDKVASRNSYCFISNLIICRGNSKPLESNRSDFNFQLLYLNEYVYPRKLGKPAEPLSQLVDGLSRQLKF